MDFPGTLYLQLFFQIYRCANLCCSSTDTTGSTGSGTNGAGEATFASAQNAVTLYSNDLMPIDDVSVASVNSKGYTDLQAARTAAAPAYTLASDDNVSYRITDDAGKKVLLAQWNFGYFFAQDICAAFVSSK